MPLSTSTAKALLVGLANQTAGNEIASLLNNVEVLDVATHVIAGAIVATNVSQTVDFGSLVVGDQILMLASTAGNARFLTCATAGTLPVAAIVGNLYVVIRAVTYPSASAVKL